MRAKFSTLSILKGPLLTLKNSAERIRKAFLTGISNNNNNNNNNNFISIALLSYVQGALQSCKQHY